MSAPEAGKIFNVDEPVGKDQVAFETTAAKAQAAAPNATVAHKIEENAEKVHDVAEDAAAAAASKGSSLTGEKTTTEQLKSTTNAAVAEGQHDVAVAKAEGAGYVDQAKTLASNALATAQQYIPSSVGTAGIGNNPQGIVGSIQAGANTALNTTKEYIASAQAALQPHVDAAAATAQPHIETAKATVQPHIETAKAAVQPQLNAAAAAAQPHLDKAKELVGVAPGNTTTSAPPASSTGIPAAPAAVPATSAPLESGPHTTNTPYPSTTTTEGSGKIGQI